MESGECIIARSCTPIEKLYNVECIIARSCMRMEKLYKTSIVLRYKVLISDLHHLVTNRRITDWIEN